MLYSREIGAALEGRVIQGVTSTTGGVRIDTDAGPVRLRAVADCCAHAWVEAVECCELPARFQSWDPKPTATTEHEYGDVLDIGFYDLVTDKGHCSIELRVSHNGYYGGVLELDNA